jgi:hypothetical protein
MRITLFALLLLSLAAQAADQTSRTCRVLFLDGSDNGPEKLHLFDGKSSQEVELTRMGFSPAYDIIPGDLTLSLLPKPPTPPTTGGDPPVIPLDSPKATLPAAISDFYLIVSNDLSNKLVPVKIQIVNASANTFKPGQMLWFNLTENTIGGVVGSQKLLVKPNSRIILDPPANKQEDYHANIQFIPPGKERVEPLCETSWSHDPRNRSVYFVVNSGGILPRILGFPDFRQPEKKSQ